ncbi:hypothetical protein BV898_01805 [Hypsibius exemplaris]|uniref:Uncharacterized protein n=1 Tax=Hypsibius exemplaris TaxID=2072580 RepID=A0A1W0XA41_HYPEX|nr:hypothetical protein BV898_01805 [Hypsibius exemplaris]
MPEMDWMGILFRFRNILWIYVVAGLFSPVLLLTSPCQQTLIDQCGRLITGFTPQKYLSGLVPDSAIRDDCEAFASVRLCNDKVLRPCLAAELVTLDPFIRQANEFIMLFCENDQFRRDYAHHGQCLAVVSSDINQCIANYGATVSDIAAISDNLGPQEVLHRSCCDGLHRLTQCSFEAAVRKCHPSSADFVKKFLYKMMKSTLQDWIARQCFEYQTQCGREPALAESTSPDSPGRITIPALSVSNLTSHLEALPTVVAADTQKHQQQHVMQQAATSSTTGQPPVTTGTPPLPASTPASVARPTDLSADGTDNVSAHSRPDRPSNGKPVMAEDGVIAAAGIAGAPTSSDGTGFYGATPHRPGSGKALPEKSAASIAIKTRPKNLGADTHPLARKFLLIISTIAFLCGWY